VLGFLSHAYIDMGVASGHTTHGSESPISYLTFAAHC